MRRREFLAGLLLGAAMSRAQAQQPGRLRRIGIVLEGGSYRAGVDGLREGLRAAGLEEGPWLAVAVRDVEGNLEAVAQAARAFERDDVDLIVSFATSVTLAVKRSTAKIPVVFIVGSDPAAQGLVSTFARPSGRFTGISFESVDLTSKRLEILREIVPTIRRVMTYYNPGNPSATSALALARQAAQRLNLDLAAKPVRSTRELDEALSAFGAEQADGYVFVSDAMVNARGDLILERAKAARIATMAYALEVVRAGALAGYGFSYYDLGRQAAGYVGRILAGASPGELPVEAISVPALAINLRTAKALDIEVPPSMLARADEVVE